MGLFSEDITDRVTLDILGRPRLRSAAIDVLLEQAIPMRVDTLALLSWAKLSWHPSTPENHRYAVEHLREEAAKRSGGLAYVGEPWCVVYLQRWFGRRDTLLNIERPLSLPIDQQTEIAALTEALERIAYLRMKGATAERFAYRVRRGFVLQYVVLKFLRSIAPTIMKPASNEGQWDKPAPDDARFELPGRSRWIDLDVAGADGARFGLVREKARADVHVIARLIDAENRVEVSGWECGEAFAEGGDIINTRSLSAMLTELRSAELEQWEMYQRCARAERREG